MKDLPHAVKGKVVLRFEPSVSGPLHIGHSYGLGLNYLYAQKYKGKLILRLSDTNPENIYPDAYTLIQEDAAWLTQKGISKIVIQSSRMQDYYKTVEALLKKGHAYVCTCDSERFKILVERKEACPDRSLEVKEQIQRFKRMFKDYKKGDVVVRLKTDIRHPNPAMRDFPLMRVNTHDHELTKKKYRVWPLMNLAVAVDDHFMKVTHVINGKDHRDNGLRQAYIYEYMEWKRPVYLHWGRINFEGLTLSTTQTRKAIQEKKYDGWDDIRLPFLQAFRRRGYSPEALLKFAASIGLSETDKTVPIHEFFKSLDHYNKILLDDTTPRYFLIRDPVKIHIEESPSLEVCLPLHPEHHERGMRRLNVVGDFYLEKKDVDRLEEGKIHRLMDCFNFVKEKKRFVFHSSSYGEFRKAKNKGLILHFLPVEKEMLSFEVLLLDKSVMKGYAEKNLLVLKKDAVIQAERFAFLKLDKKEKKKLIFWYLHR